MGLDLPTLHKGSCPLGRVMENVSQLLAEGGEFSLLVIFFLMAGLYTAPSPHQPHRLTHLIILNKEAGERG